MAEAFVLFEVAETTYAIRSRDVRYLEMIEHITPVPDALYFVEGVVFSRGQVIPALSLRARFGFEKIPYDLRTRLVVTQIGERTVGFIVDAAREFASIAEAILPPPEEISELSAKYLEGVARLGERVVLVLDPQEILKPSEADSLPEGEPEPGVTGRTEGGPGDEGEPGKMNDREENQGSASAPPDGRIEE